MPGAVAGDWLARWFAFLPADPVADLLLSIALILGAVLTLFRLRLGGGLQFFVLTLTLLGTESLLVAADNAILFYVGWEIAAFLAWAIGWADTAPDATDRTEWPVQLAGVIASIMMILGLWAISGTSGTFVLSRMRPADSAWVSLLFLGAILLKTLALVGYASRESRQRGAWASSAFLVTGAAFLVGIYPFTRLLIGIFSDLTYWQWREASVWIGLGGAALCAFAALGESDVRRALSYGAFGQLLSIFAALALPNSNGVAGTIHVLVVYSFGITALYLAFGVVDLVTGERHLSTLGGLGSNLPWIGVMALMAALATAGIPPLGSAVGQLLLVSTLVKLNSLVPAALYLLSLLLTVLYLLRIFRGVFLGTPSHAVRAPGSRFAILGLVLSAALVLGASTLSFWSEGLVSPVVGFLIR